MSGTGLLASTHLWSLTGKGVSPCPAFQAGTLWEQVMAVSRGRLLLRGTGKPH